MFLNHYQLQEQPFGVTPDPKYTYFTSTHREALASLAYAVEIGSGFAVLVAKPGMGKTTLLFRLLDYLQDKARTVFVFHTQCNSVDLMRYILADMKIKYSGKDLVEMHALLNEALLSEARLDRTVVVAIDESQNLSHDVLETIRLLSDFETPRRKLLQIILCGQPQLGHKLAHPDLVQLRQRITVLCRLAPLSLEEVAGYVDHRLRIAGHSGESLFSPEAVQLIFNESRGIPRVINTLCSGALSIGCALGRNRIDPDVVQEVLSDLSVDSLLKEMATETPPKAIARDEAAQDAANGATYMHEAPLTQALAAALAMPPAKAATAEQEGISLLHPNDIAVNRSPAHPQTIATMIPDTTVLPKTDEPAEGAAPAATEAPILREASPSIGPSFSGITPGANQPKSLALWTTLSQILESKREWIAGTVLLATILVWATLYFGAPGTKIGAGQPIVSNSATAVSLSGQATSPAETMPSSEKKVLPVDQDPAKEHTASTDPVVHVVQTNETLSGISVEYFGHYDTKVLEEMLKDNADLRDPDLILVGQKVILPAFAGDRNLLEKKSGGLVEGKP